MHIHTFWLFLFLMMLEESIQYREIYKIKKPFKIRPRYRQRPHYRPRWHSAGLHKQRYKTPPRHEYYQSHDPHYPRYPPHFTDNDYFEDQSQQQPYVIEIELPKKFGSYNNKLYDRHYDRSAFYDDDYFEEDEDFETKVIRSGQKRLKVKVSKRMNPKLRIKISRADNEEDIDGFSIPEIINSLLKNNEKQAVRPVLVGPFQSDWFPINPPQNSRYKQVT